MEFNYKNPDYHAVFCERQARLDKIKSNHTLVTAMRTHYAQNPIDFINDWGMTFDPREAEEGRLASIPFILWEKQKEYVRWLVAKMTNGEYGIVEKSRDCGVTWITVAVFVCYWLFKDGFSAGFGSATREKVDTLGNPDSIFEKIRFFVDHIPEEFMPRNYNERLHSGFMKLINPDNGATIMGGSGRQIGRGGRKSVWALDESAFIEDQMAAANAVSMSTNCHIDISTYNGSGNIFYEKSMRFDNTDHKFIFDWRDDPRKDEIWYAKQKAEKDPVTVAQEIDRDPHAAAADIFIPSEWIKASIDLHELIKIPPSGIRVTAFDPADTGDAKAVGSRYGYVVTEAKQMLDGDITNAIPWAYEEAFRHQSQVLTFDADGMGAPSMKLTFSAQAAGRISIHPFYGSGEVLDKDLRYGEDPKKPDKSLRTNQDKFANFRGQAATWLRDLFEQSYKVRQQIESGGVAMGVDVTKIISLSSKCTDLHAMVAELSRPKRIYQANTGKILVESKEKMKKRKVKSPNLFDVVMMLFATRVAPEHKQTRYPTKKRAMRDRGVGM